jgi:hypothetical protein
MGNSISSSKKIYDINIIKQKKLSKSEKSKKPKNKVYNSK